MINQYLQQLTPEEGYAIYNLLGNLKYPGFIGILLWASVKYRVSAKNKIVLWLTFAAAILWGGEMVPALYRITGGIIPKINMGVVFAFFVAVLAAMVYFLNVPVLLSLDIAIPAFILGRGLAITGCLFAGCCHGFPMPWGIYSGAAKTLTFPTVPLDILVSCSIVIHLMVLTSRQKYSGNGIVAATGMILFGILRLFIDILRDNQKLIFVLTAEGFFGIAYILAGWLLLRYISHKKMENRPDSVSVQT